MANVSPEPNSGCWLWLGSVDRYGYGRYNGKRAHRLAYELRGEPIPSGLQIDHLCRVRCCVNPVHMEPVTSGENTRRGLNIWRLRTHCPKGHEYSPANTRTSGGARFCRACSSAYNRRRWLARKGSP